jgi:tripartite-type tricarboxylate transporter receptor subunit TctC
MGGILRPHIARVLLGCGLWSAAAAFAQGYPAKPVRLVVPYPAGGVNDIIARVLAQKLGEALGQQMVIDNRPGAGGNLGTDHVAKSVPDGYTLLSGGVGSLTMNPGLGKVPYDTLRDFAPIALIANAPNVLTVHPSLPVRSTREFIALAKTRPAQIHYGSGGVGSTPHLSGALFAVMAGIDLVHVSYKGGAQAMTDLMGGHVQMSFAGIPPALPHIRSGKLRALGVSSAQRSAQLPDVPPIGDAVPGYDVNPWFGILAPKGVPEEIIARLGAETARALRNPDLRERLLAQGCEPNAGTPDDFAQTLRIDLARWSKLIADTRIRAD